MNEITIYIKPQVKSYYTINNRVFPTNRMKSYINEIKAGIQKYYNGGKINKPVKVIIGFYFYKKKDDRIKSTRPDLDNLAKPVLDALMQIIEDDALIYELTLAKYYSSENDKVVIKIMD